MRRFARVFWPRLAAEARYTAVDQIRSDDLKRWLAKARDIQWDCRNLRRRKGRLERLK